MLDLGSDEPDPPGNVQFDDLVPNNQFEIPTLQESKVGSENGSTEDGPETTDGVHSMNSSCAGSVCATQPPLPINHWYPYDFDTMTPAEIYDEFHKGKAKNLGFCARFVLSKMVKDQI